MPFTDVLGVEDDAPTRLLLRTNGSTPRMAGSCDIPLSALGEAQLDPLDPSIFEGAAAVVYTSPLPGMPASGAVVSLMNLSDSPGLLNSQRGALFLTVSWNRAVNVVRAGAQLGANGSAHAALHRSFERGNRLSGAFNSKHVLLDSVVDDDDGRRAGRNVFALQDEISVPDRHADAAQFTCCGLRPRSPGCRVRRTLIATGENQR